MSDFNEKKFDFWGGPEDEILTATTKNDAIAKIIDDLAGYDYGSLDPLPQSIEVAGFNRMTVEHENLAETILESTLGHLDSNYSSSNDDSTDETEPMRAAALAFAKVMVAEYTPHDLHHVHSEWINVAAWLREFGASYFSDWASIRVADGGARS